jgi:hypothetical protein
MKIILSISPEASIKSMGMIDRLNNKDYYLDVVPNVGDFLLIHDNGPVRFQLLVTGRVIDSLNRFVEIRI